LRSQYIIDWEPIVVQRSSQADAGYPGRYVVL
jgi:hypothetical protein